MTSEKQSVRLWRHLLRVPASALADQWKHGIQKESFKFKDLEHVGIEKVEQLFRDMPSCGPAGAWRLGMPTKWPSTKDDAWIGVAPAGRRCRGFQKAIVFARAGLSVEEHEEKLEIVPPMAKSNFLALCLAASGCKMACMWGNFRLRSRLSVSQDGPEKRETRGASRHFRDGDEA